MRVFPREVPPNFWLTRLTYRVLQAGDRQGTQRQNGAKTRTIVGLLTGTPFAIAATQEVSRMMSPTVERIASLASLLEDPLQEKLWEYAELLYVEQVAFDTTDSGSPYDTLPSPWQWADENP